MFQNIIYIYKYKFKYKFKIAKFNIKYIYINVAFMTSCMNSMNMLDIIYFCWLFVG